MVDLEKYYGLVIYRARKFHAALPAASRETISLEDLVQVGYLRLAQAKTQYQADQGATFTTYAMRLVEFAIIDHLRQHDPLTIRERQRLKVLEKAAEELSQRLGRKPFITELAQFADLTEEEVQTTLDLRIYISSINAPNQDDGLIGGPLAVDPLAPDPGPEEQVMKQRLAQSVDLCLQTALDADERRITTLRFTGGLTRARIGALLDLNPSKVERLERVAKRKLRSCLETKGWEIRDI